MRKSGEHRTVQETGGNRRRVVRLLAECFLEGAGPDWPGADGLTVEEVAREYPRAVASGLVPSVKELASRHPDLAAGIAAFFLPKSMLPTIG